jgi:hypothetical protein
VQRAGSAAAASMRLAPLSRALVVLALAASLGASRRRAHLDITYVAIAVEGAPCA